jgi:hypothetical protein
MIVYAAYKLRFQKKGNRTAHPPVRRRTELNTKTKKRKTELCLVSSYCHHRPGPYAPGLVVCPAALDELYQTRKKFAWCQQQCVLGLALDLALPSICVTISMPVSSQPLLPAAFASSGRAAAARTLRTCTRTTNRSATFAIVIVVALGTSRQRERVASRTSSIGYCCVVLGANPSMAGSCICKHPRSASVHGVRGLNSHAGVL